MDSMIQYELKKKKKNWRARYSVDVINCSFVIASTSFEADSFKQLQTAPFILTDTLIQERTFSSIILSVCLHACLSVFSWLDFVFSLIGC